MKNVRRPPTKTIRRVVEWLGEHGFSVYGDNIHGNFRYLGLRDFSDADEIVKIAKLISQNKIEDSEEY